MWSQRLDHITPYESVIADDIMSDLWSLFDRLVMKDNFLMGNFVLFKPGKPLFQCWTSAEVTF